MWEIDKNSHKNVAIFCLLVIIVDVIIELVQNWGSNVIQTVIRVVNEFITNCNLSNKSNFVFAIVLIFKCIFITIICDRIGRIFKDSKEAETPFCDANVRSIGIVSELTWLYTIFCVESFAGYELVISTLLSVIYYIFKYGCELQEQSDETL